MIFTILIIVQVFVAIALVVLILLQHGKGADAGAAFGSGASGTVFGAKWSANFMIHATAGLATLFVVLSLSLAYVVNDTSSGSSATSSVTDQLLQEGGQGSATENAAPESSDKQSPSGASPEAGSSEPGSSG